MRKIFGRAGFLPLPLRERAGVRGILFSVFLIAAGNFAAFGQNSGTQTQNTAPSATAKESRLMSSAVKKGFEKRKAELETMLADYHAGKYTDVQGHAILVQILFACGQLKEKQSSDCRGALKEYKALNRAHPEFQNPPEFRKKYPNLTASDLLNIELPSQKAAREAADKKEQDIKEMAKN